MAECTYTYKGQTYTRQELEDYIKSNPQEFSTDTNVEEFADLYEPDEEVGVYKKYMEFKKSQIRLLEQKLSNIKVLKRENKSNEEILSQLNKIEHDINLRLDGSEDLNIKGLRKEIDELSKNPEISAIGYYVEKDLQRLEKLSKSNNPQDLDEAQQIVNFYVAAGTFHPDVNNPFFESDDLFFDDGTLKLEDFVLEPFKEWRARSEYFQAILDTQKEKVTTDMVNSNTKVQKLYGEGQLSFSDIIHKKTGLKDLNWIDMWAMDVTSGIFSKNGMLPQVMMDELRKKFEDKTKWSKHIEEKITQIQPQVEKELDKMGFGFKALGIINIKGVSYDLFRQTDKHGRQTGRLTHRHSKEFFDARSNMDAEFSRKINEAENETNAIVKAEKYSKAFQYRKAWYTSNVIVLDINKLPEIVGENEESNNYKNKLIEIIGEQGYKEEVSKQQEQIKSYEIAHKTYIENILTENGKTSVDELDERNKSVLAFWEARNSPFKGVEDYYNQFGISVGDKRVYNFMSYNISIPRKKIAKASVEDGKYIFHNTTTETGYYDSSYEKIEANPTLKEFYDIMSDVTKTIKESLPPDLQEKMTVNTIPALKKNMVEILSDKNIPFYKAISLAARELYDRIVKGIRVVKQGEISAANVDVITGLPRYSVNTSFLQGNAQEINQRFTIEKNKFIGLYNQTMEDDRKITKLTKFTGVHIDSINPAALNVLAEYLGVEPNKKAIRERTGDLVNITKVIRDFATHTIVQQQSFDLPKIVKYYSHMAMEYAARQEILPIMKIMKEHYNDIKAPATTNVGESIINYNEETRLEGVRGRANSQMEDWWDRVVLGNYDTKHIGVVEAIKKNKPQTAREKAEEVANILSGKNIRNKKYTSEEKRILKEVDDILATETNEGRRKELEDIKNQLGGNFSATAMFDSLLTFIRLKGLGWNISSQLTNLAEGTTANMIIAASGDYFEPHLIYEGYHIVKGSFLKSVTFNAIETKGAKKARVLVDRYRILQDASNELQKASAKTNFSWTAKLSPYELIRRTEYINQTPLMIAMLKHLKLKGVDGQESSIWDALDENGKLKEGFNTQENKENWEDASGMQYKDFKSTLSKAIVVAHGNYDDKRGMMAKSTIVGKALLMFKTWITSAFYQRFASEQDDLESGIKGFYGRYWSHTPATGAMMGALPGILFFGPIGAVIGGTIGTAMAHTYGKRTNKGFFEELIYTNKSLFKKMIGMPVNLIAGKNIINSNNDFEKLIGEGNFSERDAKNMRSNMADMSILLVWMLLTILAKSFLYDDDEPESKERMAHNLLVNRFLQLASQSSLYTNPSGLKENVLDMASIKFFTDLGKEGVALQKYIEGDDILSSGINSGDSRLWNQTFKTFMPGLFRDKYLGFGSQMDRQFTPSPIDNYFKSEENKQRSKVKGERAKRKNELKEQGIDDKKIEKILNKELPMPKKKKKESGK